MAAEMDTTVLSGVQGVQQDDLMGSEPDLEETADYVQNCVFSQMRDATLRQCGHQVDMVRAMRLSNVINSEGGSGQISIRRFCGEMAIEFKKWKLSAFDFEHDRSVYCGSFREYPFLRLLQWRSEQLLLSFKTQGAEISYDEFRAAMGHLRWMVDEEHNHQLAMLTENPEEAERRKAEFRTKLDFMRQSVCLQWDYFLAMNFVFPMSQVQAREILLQRTLRIAYQTIGIQALKDAQMSRREMVVWVAKHLMRHFLCDRRCLRRP